MYIRLTQVERRKIIALKTNYKDDILDLTQNDKRCFEEIQNVNLNTVTITLKVRAYIDGVLKNAGETYSFTIGSGYSMPSHIVAPV